MTATPTPGFVHSDRYDIRLPGLDWLHPFDGRRGSRALALAQTRFGEAVSSCLTSPAAAVCDADLLRVHTAEYLQSLCRPAAVARALEVSALSLLPHALLEHRILSPMRWAVAGTLLAVELALSDKGIVMNLGGGFHHAFPDHGEGFCVYADAAVALASARAKGLLGREDPVAVIDLDAHRGNGFWAACGEDPSVRVFDIYNFQAYPGLFPGEPEDFPFQLPVKAGTGDTHYLDLLEEQLPAFLDAGPLPRLAVYNAGSDVIEGDLIGRLALSREGLKRRDAFVLRQLVARAIPIAIVTSGGYSAGSHECVAGLAEAVLTACGGVLAPS